MLAISFFHPTFVGCFFFAIVIFIILIRITMEKILQKLAKLKSLYDSARMSNEGEAEAAAAAINRLLVKYNLTMEQVENTKLKDNSLNNEDVSGFTFKSIGGEWELELYKVICNYNFCKVFIRGGGYKRLMIVGKKENLDNVKWLKDFLSNTFVGLSKRRWKEYEEKNMCKDKFQRHYLLGCVMGVRDKFEEQRKNIEKQYNNVTSLVVKTESSIMNYVENIFGHVGTVNRRHKSYEGEILAKGRIDGYNIDINKPINSHEKKSKLISKEF